MYLWLWAREAYPILQNLQDDEKAITTTISAFISFFMIFATFSFAKAYSHRSDARRARDERNFDKFVLCVRRRLHPANYAIISLLALLILAGFYLISFKNIICGVFAIGGITLLIALFMEVVRDVDHAFLGVWNVEDIPNEWSQKLVELGLQKRPA